MTLKLGNGERDFRNRQFAVRGETEGRLAGWRNSSLFKGGNKMKPSTKDEIEGKVHEVKSKIKEKSGQLTNNCLASAGTGEGVLPLR